MHCWVVWHNVHSQQHTHMSSSYRSSRFGLSHWDPYTICRGGCLELYYCNMVEWCWWDSSLIWKTNWFPSVLWRDVKPCSLTHSPPYTNPVKNIHIMFCICVLCSELQSCTQKAAMIVTFTFVFCGISVDQSMYIFSVFFCTRILSKWGGIDTSSAVAN